MTLISWTAYGNYLKVGIKIATTIKVKGIFEQSKFCNGYLIASFQSTKIAKNNAWVNKPYFLDEKSYANSLLIFKVAEWISFY